MQREEWQRLGAVGLVLLASRAPLARAEAEPDSLAAQVLTLDAALLAAGAAPDVVAARANQQAASARLRLAKAPGEPSMSFETHSITSRGSLAVSIPFRWAGQRAAAVRTAEAEQETAARSHVVAMATARRATRVAWFTLAASEERLRSAAGQAARSETNRRAVADMLDVERASRLDAARASSEAASALAARAKAEHEVIAASAELRALLGVTEPRLSAGDAQPTPPPEGTLEPWRERALANSPELAVAASELRAAQAVVDQRSKERLPNLSLEAGADWDDPTQPGTDAMVGLGITFPTHARASLDVARADHDRAVAMFELSRRRVEADVESAWSATRSARLRYEALDAQARPAAADAAEMTRIGYTEGRLDLFHLLDAERSLAEIERDRADAYQDWGTAFADLERLAPEATP